MSNLSTSLKTWGAQGSEYPDGYNYTEGEQPVDAWDNYLTHNVISDIQSLIDVVNSRLETDKGDSLSHPDNPEEGHLYWDIHADRLEAWDNGLGEWYTHLRRDGDRMNGAIDMNGNQIQDGTGTISLRDTVEARGATLDHDWYSKFEGGTVPAGSSVPLRTVRLADGDTISLTEAHLSEDGFTTPAATDVALAIVADDGTTTTVLNGDGSTLYDQETGDPVASYQNTSGGAQTVMVALDNGEYTTGNGSDQQAFGGFIVRVA